MKNDKIIYGDKKMGFSVDIRVVSSSGRSMFKIDRSGKLKCYVKSPPEKGLANREVIKLIAKSLGISRDMVHITRGLTSRKKRICIDVYMTYQQFLQAIGVEWQIDMFG